MVSLTMVFIARRFLIFAALQFVVITRYYASLCLAKNKNQRTLNPIQLRFLGLILFGFQDFAVGIKLKLEFLSFGPDFYLITNNRSI